MGAIVNTVTGPIDSKDLGVTLMHEHVFQYDNTMRYHFAGWFDPDQFMEKWLLVAKKTTDAGIKTLVDMSNLGLGRDIRLLRRAADESGLQIIASTGLYYTEEPYQLGKDPKEMADYFMQDILEGCEGTDMKAGIIKCATDTYGFTERNIFQLTSAAMAAAKTGTPITTHTVSKLEHGHGQLDVFEKYGVDLSKVIIGHCGDTNNLDYLESIMKRGAFIGLDRFGSDFIWPEEDRINNLCELLDRGWIKQITLSHDAPYFYDFDYHNMKVYNERDPFKPEPVVLYTHINDSVLPKLRERGVSEEEIETMLVKNPQRVFNGNYECE